jgi:hypothetical protein
MDLGGEIDEGNKMNPLWELMEEIDDHVKYMIRLI